MAADNSSFRRTRQDFSEGLRQGRIFLVARACDPTIGRLCRVGASEKPGAVQLAEANELSDSLPLLELALTRLFEADGGWAEKVLTLATYDGPSGGAGLKRIIGAYAERALDEAVAVSTFDRAAIEQAAAALILGLADLDVTGHRFSRLCDAGVIRADPARAGLLDDLIKSRLVVEVGAGICARRNKHPSRP